MTLEVTSDKQSGASYLLQGFEDNVLGSSSGWLADTVARYLLPRQALATHMETSDKRLKESAMNRENIQDVVM